MVIEDRPREYLERRVRAGLLEQNTVDLLRALDVGERLDREGLVHDGIYLRREGRTQHIEIAELTGRHVTIYGQQEVVKDLIAALLDRGGKLRFEVSDVSVGISLAMTMCFLLACLAIVGWMFRTGYRLKN